MKWFILFFLISSCMEKKSPYRPVLQKPKAVKKIQKIDLHGKDPSQADPFVKQDESCSKDNINQGKEISNTELLGADGSCSI